MNFSSNPKTNGYFVYGKNNSQLVRLQLDELKLDRYERLPRGGVKFNWITRLTSIDWSTFDSNFQIVNHIENEGQLSNKALLLNNLKIYEKYLHTSKLIDDHRKNFSLKTFLPQTFLLDKTIDRIQFEKQFQSGSIWICKPTGLSCGREIFIFQDEKQLKNHLEEFYANSHHYSYSTLFYNRLVQKYIDNPLLINRRKFDIRTYLLCICTSNDILCFAAQTGYLRLSMFEFDRNNFDKFIHLTNQTIQNKNDQFSSMKDQTGMTMEDFNEYFNQRIQPEMQYIENDWVRKELPKKITNILQYVSDAVRHRLIRREGTFGFYGVDILIDQQLNCWLLEINSGPTLDMTNSALENVIPRCLQAAFGIVIEVLNKSRAYGSPFPLIKNDIFHYLPPSNPLMNRMTHLYTSISTFISLNPTRIDLTPGVFRSTSRYPLKSMWQKKSSLIKRRTSSLSPLRNDYRKDMSDQLEKYLRKTR